MVDREHELPRLARRGRQVDGRFTTISTYFDYRPDGRVTRGDLEERFTFGGGHESLRSLGAESVLIWQDVGHDAQSAGSATMVGQTGAGARHAAAATPRTDNASGRTKHRCG